MNQGQQAEQQAADYLQRQGLTLVAQNVRYPFGELDLVMRHGPYWVFVEVKFRSGNQFGGALNAIGAAQVARIRRAASHYLQRQHIDAPCRFDVIAIEAGQIRWLQGAF
jgi:putative endonuclease